MHLPTGLPLPININRRIDNKDYLDMVENVDARHAYFGALTNPKEGDHSEILKVKNMLSTIIEQEAA